MEYPGAPRSIAVEERRSIAALFRQLFEDVTQLARAEVKLARAEVTANVQKLVRPIILVVAAALLGITAVFTLAGAAVAALTPVVGAAVAALIVAILLAIVAYLLLQSGLKGLSSPQITPKRAVQSVKTDVAVVKEELS